MSPFLGAGEGGEEEEDDSNQGWARETPQDMPNHDAHRSDPPRGGDRE